MVSSGARVEAVAQSGTVELLDARLPRNARAENLAALDAFRAKSAPFYLAIRDGAEEYGAHLRAELNALAGGEAPPSVMALAQAAVDALSNCQLAQHIVGHATGDLPGLPEKKQPARRLEITQLQRTAMGLDVAFTDLVRRATEAAKEAGKKGSSPTQQLMARLGHGAKAPDPVPPQAPGGSSVEPPPSLSQPPFPPEPGGTK